MLALLALCHPFHFLCFFASLHACLHVHAWVCVSSTLQSHGIMNTQSKPTFFLLGHHLFVCKHVRLPFHVHNMLVCPHLSSFVSLSFSILPFYLFLCLSTGLFLFSLHVHAWGMDIWSNGAPSLVKAKRARMQARRCKPIKDNVQYISGPSPSWVVFTFSRSLSLSLFSRECIRVPFLLIPFTFPALCLGRIPWVWQCLFYISCTLLGHTLGTLAMSVLLSLFYVIALCIMYVYIYIYICRCVCGWSCTLYDGLSWLRERPSLAISPLDLVTWVYAQSD